LRHYNLHLYFGNNTETILVYTVPSAFSSDTFSIFYSELSCNPKIKLKHANLLICMLLSLGC